MWDGVFAKTVYGFLFKNKMLSTRKSETTKLKNNSNHKI